MTKIYTDNNIFSVYLKYFSDFIAVKWYNQVLIWLSLFFCGRKYVFQNKDFLALDAQINAKENLPFYIQWSWNISFNKKDEVVDALSRRIFFCNSFAFMELLLLLCC